MNVLRAFGMVKSTINTLLSQSRDLTKNCIKWANNKMDEIELDYNIEETFPVQRFKKKKMMTRENIFDEPCTNPMQNFKNNVHNIIYDQIIMSLRTRFETHSQLYNDLQFLIPDYFTGNLPNTAFQWLRLKLQKYDSSITAGTI